MHKLILRQFKKVLGTAYSPDIYENILEQSSDSTSLQSITLLAHKWSNPVAKKSFKKLETELGIITLLGWVGYTVLDHAIDRQRNILKYIPLAELCLRELHWRLSRTCLDKSEARTVSGLLELIERAHGQECLGRVPVVWHKSAGHMIAPLILTLRQGHSPRSSEFVSTKRFFVDFLSCKQISDDLRDWEQDWKAGRNTPVTEHVRKQFKKSILSGKKPSLSLNFVREKFTICTLPFYCKLILNRGNHALKSIETSGNHRDPEYFRNLIYRLQKGASNALEIISKIKKAD
jgi:hypothetical protein